MKTKNIVVGMLLIFAMIWIARWAKVSFQPLYSDVRFQPSDKLHAECTNSADILFSPQGQRINKIKIILSYNPETLEILRIVPLVHDGSVTSKIEYNRIVLDIDNPKFAVSTETKWFFTIHFRSKIVGKDTITIIEWSEAVTANKTYPLAWSFNLEFASVPECEPDVIPPSINLIYPKDSSERIHLDQHFIFDIKDIGKGVDKTSVRINFNNEQYMYWWEHLKRKGNYLTFYPSSWIPIDTKLDLKIVVTDQQTYGWSNRTESMYTFQSATWIYLQKDISPILFRKIAQEAEKISASLDECSLLWELYRTSDLQYQNELKSIIQKLWCSMAGLSTNIWVRPPTDASTKIIQKKHYRNISVFWTIGWILFFITFSLKLHYFYEYKKHKKIHTAKRTPKS